MVQEHVTAYDFDGDGRPVVEKDNQRTYPRNDPPSGGLVATPKVFQIWSSVLGSNLVTFGGYTGGTKVFAGGTLIGTANANAGSRWATADPVIGTTVRWAGSNGVWEKAAEETEPLGQVIANTDPDTENDPGYDFAARNSAFPQWQCDLPDDVRPMECRIREEIESSLNGTSIKSIWDPNKKDGDPSFIHVNDPPPDSARDMPGTVTHQATHSTAKPIDQAADGATTVPTQNPDNCDGDVDLENNRVNIRCGDSTIPEDFKDASDGSPPIDDGDQLQRANQALDAVEEILWGDSQCSRFFGGPALFAFYRLKRQLIGANVTSFADNDYAGIRMDDTGDSKPPTTIQTAEDRRGME
ncbi:MAG: hypothetical protein IPN69_09205 [Acidobacteria bacterium]|nr:hypothetical protein [Acidobacteriota bacterium]